MRPKTDVELNRAALLKTTRSLVRLRHSLAADRELNEVLPDTLADFDKALANGELKAVEDQLGAVLGRK